MKRRAAAEFAGTLLLSAIIVGSGIMGTRLAPGNDAMALLANSLATGAGLVVLILMFGPVSGAHFNPLVTGVMLAKREINGAVALAYSAAQSAGALIGVWAAHAMFALPLFQLSANARDDVSLGFAEVVASFGLIGTILCVRRARPDCLALAVGLYIVAGYWFTASTSFSNPAVTIARSFTDSFTGIAILSVPLFVAGQITGAALATLFFGWLLKADNHT